MCWPLPVGIECRPILMLRGRQVLICSMREAVPFLNPSFGLTLNRWENHVLIRRPPRAGCQSGPAMLRTHLLVLQALNGLPWTAVSGVIDHWVRIRTSSRGVWFMRVVSVGNPRGLPIRVDRLQLRRLVYINMIKESLVNSLERDAENSRYITVLQSRASFEAQP